MERNNQSVFRSLPSYSKQDFELRRYFGKNYIINICNNLDYINLQYLYFTVKVKRSDLIIELYAIILIILIYNICVSKSKLTNPILSLG